MVAGFSADECELEPFYCVAPFQTNDSCFGIFTFDLFVFLLLFAVGVVVAWIVYFSRSLVSRKYQINLLDFLVSLQHEYEHSSIWCVLLSVI